MKRTLGAVAALFGLLATLLLGTAAANATTPPSHCYNGTYLGLAAVICEIDINDDGVLNGNDIKVIIPLSVLNHSQLNLLVVELDKVTGVSVPIDIGDITILKDVVVNVYDLIDLNLDPDVIVVVPCGCPH